MTTDPPKLLSGGNPQIPKGYGEGPVRAYIAAMPGWKRAVGEALDAAVDHAVPDVQKAVKYNQPLYGLGDDHWFFSFRCFTKYVKLTFFDGTALDPPPPRASKQPRIRYADIREGAELDLAQLRDWMAQASRQPGEKL